jgi:hypothetical protein
MAKEPGGGGGARPSAGKELPQHPLVESLKPDPAQPAKKIVVLIGLPGKSDRPGYQRLYLTTKLNYYAEFLVSGILNSETIRADKSPFPGHEATQVTVGRDANIQYITATSPQPVDEFDLDVRLGAQAAAAAAVPFGELTDQNTCLVTCNTCLTQCACTGLTQCNQDTCVGTCQTQCNQNTCDCGPPGTLNTCAEACPTHGCSHLCTQ